MGFTAAVTAAWRDLPHGQRPTRLHLYIAKILAGWGAGRSPRHGQLARACCCSTRTVQRALARLHALGLLSWTRRVVRGPGWRAQISNAYQLLSPKPLSFLRVFTSATLSGPAPVVPAAGLTAASEARVLAAWRARRGGD